MKRLRPSATAGVPGNVPPITSKSPAETCARYQVDGRRVPRCGSLASSGLPLAVRVPSTTQLLEPSPSVRVLVRKSRTEGSPGETAAMNARDQEDAGWGW